MSYRIRVLGLEGWALISFLALMELLAVMIVLLAAGGG
jgi:hypothetical protein